MLTIKYKRGPPSTEFRIRGHRTDLGDRGCFRGWKCNFGIYEPIWSFYTSNFSKYYIKGGCYTFLTCLDLRSQNRQRLKMRLLHLWTDLAVSYFKMLKMERKRGLPSTGFRIRGHRTDLGDGGCFRGWKCDICIYELIWLFKTLKCWQWYIKGGYLLQVLVLEVTGRI